VIHLPARRTADPFDSAMMVYLRTDAWEFHATPSMIRGDDIVIRTTLRPGDVETIVELHRATYAREYGSCDTFATYVAEPLRAFAWQPRPRARVWIAERDGAMVGCVAIVEVDARVAQLRWFLVEPAARGMGLGRRLLDDAVSFARSSGLHERHPVDGERAASGRTPVSLGRVHNGAGKARTRLGRGRDRGEVRAVR
jgi:GNAT superfamily N-acetyltransferase